PKQEAKGEVLLNGENILAPGYSMNRLRSHVGMVFQKPVPFPIYIFDKLSYELFNIVLVWRVLMFVCLDLDFNGSYFW
ncbi:hypothetical protein QN348_22770, partial [Mucilaginibacter sp. 5C4]|nr:hypothetical protein [Mucilaginibacter sp. 5C4]